METRTYTVYKFNELSEEQQKKVLDRYRDFNTDENSDWYDSVYDDAKQVAELMGIDVDKIYFSGFWSQGDGACFEGRYSYKKGSLKAVKSYAPLDNELHRIAKELTAIQKQNFYKLEARIKHSGFYQHSNCTKFYITKEGEYYFDSNDSYVRDNDKAALVPVIRDFMDWIYKQLEKEYEYLTSDEAIKESLIANDYDFTNEGRID